MRLFVFFLLAFSVACGSQTAPTRQPGSTTGLPSAASAVIIAAEGDISLKRDTWTDFFPTHFGAVISQSDLLQTHENARVVVLCTDWETIWEAPVGKSGVNGCPRTVDTILQHYQQDTLTPRGPQSSEIPYIVSPRMMNVLSQRPMLRWNAPAGVNRYTVKVVEAQSDRVVWQEVTDKNIIQYGGSPLTRSNVYSILVAANNDRTSLEENTPGLSFRILPKDRADAVLGHVDDIKNLELPMDAETLALAHLFWAEGLLTEAILELEEARDAGSEQPALFLLLGQLYAQIGLHGRARDAYVVAATNTSQAESPGAQADIYLGLGKAYAQLGDRELAQLRLGAAAGIYRKLGDAARAEQAEAELEALTRNR